MSGSSSTGAGRRLIRVLGDLVKAVEVQAIGRALDLAAGHLGKVAAWLGISRVTLRKKLAEHRLESGKTDEGKREN